MKLFFIFALTYALSTQAQISVDCTGGLRLILLPEFRAAHRMSVEVQDGRPPVSHLLKTEVQFGDNFQTVTMYDEFRQLPQKIRLTFQSSHVLREEILFHDIPAGRRGEKILAERTWLHPSGARQSSPSLICAWTERE